MARKRLRYVGHGDFIVNVPSRDLTVDEARKYGVKRLLESGLYKDLYPKRKINIKPVEEIQSEISQEE